jgi:hypothetical protein
MESVRAKSIARVSISIASNLLQDVGALPPALGPVKPALRSEPASPVVGQRPLPAHNKIGKIIGKIPSSYVTHSISE